MWPAAVADALLEHTFGGAPIVQPTEWWVQLHYGAPGSAGTTNAWAGAGRRETEMAVLPSGDSTNLDDLEWTELPNPGGNPEVTHCTIWDDELAGTCLQVCDLAHSNGSQVSVAAGQGFRIPAGGLLVDWKGLEEELSSSSLSIWSSSSSSLSSGSSSSSSSPSSSSLSASVSSSSSSTSSSSSKSVSELV